MIERNESTKCSLSNVEYQHLDLNNHAIIKSKPVPLLGVNVIPPSGFLPREIETQTDITTDDYEDQMLNKLKKNRSIVYLVLFILVLSFIFMYSSTATKFC